MEIGFVSFNQEALNRANKVMKLLQGQGAIDELGLGRIRDAFSNTMFPGMSVLQTHAKYFLLMPALYAYLEKTRIADVREAREVVREHEIRLTRQLMDGSADDAVGIIGADMLSRGEGYVKYDPTYVYQAGMETYGLIPPGGNVYATLAERSSLYQSQPRRHRGSDDTEGDSADLAGLRQIFKVCGEDYDFGSGLVRLDIKLSTREAEFLKDRIVAAVGESLMAHLLDSGLYRRATEHTFDLLGELFRDELPGGLYHIYILARRFSRFAWMLRVRYAMLYDIAVGAREAAAEELAKFEGKLAEWSDDIRPEAIEEIVRFATPKISETTCTQFIAKAASLIAAGRLDELDREIVRREQAIKGPRRSKLINAKDYEPGRPFETPEMMSFRWNTIVSTVLKEIDEGLRDERSGV